MESRVAAGFPIRSLLASWIADTERTVSKAIPRKRRERSSS